MNNKKSFLVLLLIPFLLICAVPYKAHPADTPVPVYSIQFGSFPRFRTAEKEFNAITKQLQKKHRDQMRIDKIGKYYSVRLGVFKDIEDAKKLSREIKSQVSSFIIVKTHSVEERTVKKYRDPQAPKQVTRQKPQKKPVSGEPPQEGKDIKAEDKPVSVETPQEVKEVITGDKPASMETPQEVKEVKVGDEPVSMETPQEVQSDAPPAAAPFVEKSQEAVPLEETLGTVSLLFHNREYAPALEMVKAEIAQQPTHPELNAWQGTILLKMGRPSDALPYLENAVKFSPDVPDYHSSLGYAFFFMNKYDEAGTEFQNTLSLDPVHVDALSGIGMIYGINGEKEKALDIYNRLKDLDRDAASKLLNVINK